LKDEKLIKKQTYTKTEICKLYSRVLWLFLPNVMKIGPYNFELCRFKVCTFFETQCTTDVWYIDGSRCQAVGVDTAEWAACQRSTSVGSHAAGNIHPSHCTSNNALWVIIKQTETLYAYPYLCHILIGSHYSLTDTLSSLFCNKELLRSATPQKHCSTTMCM